MINSCRIVIFGNSIYMLAIESALSLLTHGKIVRINPYLSDAVERISLLEPHVVIMEQNGKNKNLILEIQQRGIPLIALDEAQHSVRVLAGEFPPIAEISELTSIIRNINQEQFERRL